MVKTNIPSRANMAHVAAVEAFCPTAHHDTYAGIDPLKADLTGLSVVITGASKGVGRATALSFARAGASRIALAARSDALLSTLETELRQAARDAGRKNADELVVVRASVDVTDEASVGRFAELVGRAFDGRVDVLVNNAGYLEDFQPLAASQPTEWWRTWEVNIRGVYLCARALLPLVLASETHKTILNVSSIGAHYIMPGASAYQTSKFALCRLTEFLVADHGRDGLVALALHPGGVETDLARGMPDRMHSMLVDQPALAADTMAWLARERREWLNGRWVSVNWDVDELVARRDDIVRGDLLKFRMAIDVGRL